MQTVKTKTGRAAEPAEAESIVNDESKLLANMEIGDVSHQGDLIIVRLGALPKSVRPRKGRQLAEGDTQGSRHVVERGEVFDADRGELASMIGKATGHTPPDAAFIGPVFVSPTEPTADDLTHPEHGNQGFPAGAVCAVIFQRNLDAEERQQMTRD